MSYQLCATRVIKELKNKFPTLIWSKENDTHKKNICDVILDDMGEYALLLDEEIFKKVFSVVYAGLNVREYIVPLIDIDIDPSLREYNEVDKEYDECVEEEMNNEFKFNIPQTR